MDGEEVKKFYGHESSLAGAIIMTNRATKQECLQRRLFGVPSSMTDFIKKIKAGMFLFLFEHEERKLYGVFEATSDGAMNIMPNAFLSLGNSFPAQVLFKRNWICRPLPENMFSGAIEDNYYAPKRFKFALSYNQVFKLLQLFSLKKINVHQYQRPGITNEIIEGFEKHGWNYKSVTGRSGPRNSVSNEYIVDDGRDPQRYLGLSGSNKNSSTYLKKLRRKRPSFVRNECGLYQVASHATEAKLPCFSRYESKPPYPSRRTFSKHQGYCGAISSPTIGKGWSPSTHESITHAGSSLDAQPQQFNSQPDTSLMDPSSIHLCPPNLILPESRKAKCTNSFPSVHPSNSHGYPEASIYESDSGGKSIGDLGPNPDYIPLPGINCFDENTSNNSSSESIEDDDTQGMRPCPKTHCETYPTIVKSRLRSDTEQSRTSVFSRLSKPCDLSESRKAFRKYEAEKRIVSRKAFRKFQRREQSIKVTKITKHSNTFEGYENFESTAEIEANKVTSPGELGSRNDVFMEGEIVEEENSEHLFFSFKRKREIGLISGKNVMNSCADSNLETLQNYKLRKVLEPFFDEEECRNVQGSTQEIDGAKPMIAKKCNDEISPLKNISASEASLHDIVFDKLDKKSEGARNSRSDTENNGSSASEASHCDTVTDKSDRISESLMKSLLDAENKMSPASEANLGDLASDKTVRSAESLSRPMKEIYNRNLRWFLQKSILVSKV